MVGEIPFSYWHKLAAQTILISSLLGGFSIAVVANLIVSDTPTRLLRGILALAVVAACLFLVALFAFTGMYMITLPDYPFQTSQDNLLVPRLIGVVALIVGIFALVGVLMLSGWTKSKRLGWLTSFFGSVTLLLIVFMLAR